MTAVCACGAGDVCAVVDEKSRVCAARNLHRAGGQFVKRACVEILFAELNERDVCPAARTDEREHVLEIFTTRSAGFGRRAACNQVDNRLWQVERHCSLALWA